MGQEINNFHFHHRDFKAFSSCLKEETELLRRWFAEASFDSSEPVGGIELEAWLIDGEGMPAPLNEAFLERLSHPLVVPELARFNVEINNDPRALRGFALSEMEAELDTTFADARRAAAELNCRVVFIGILPSATEDRFSLDYISARQRYRALNEQVLRMRKGSPLTIDIRGRERLQLTHMDVMLEAAATSLQIHLQVNQDVAARYYNAAKILTAPLTAAGANAPYFLGRDLWDETRIPLFEQAVACHNHPGPGKRRTDRVTFGAAYADDSLLGCFLENIEHYPVLLPITIDAPPEAMSHLRLHNGTIWRWNRPLVGFQNGRPHLRIEHRVISAGPVVADAVANAAFFFGLIESLARDATPPETLLSFEAARRNFYQAAEHGLDAEILWLDGRRWKLSRLIRDQLLSRARDGLGALGIHADDIARYSGLLEDRMRSGQNGTRWQRAFVERHGRDLRALTLAYTERGQTGRPVHEWDV